MGARTPLAGFPHMQGFKDRTHDLSAGARPSSFGMPARKRAAAIAMLATAGGARRRRGWPSTRRGRSRRPANHGDEPLIEAVERAGAGAPRVQTDRADRASRRARGRFRRGCRCCRRIRRDDGTGGFVLAGADGCYAYRSLRSNSSSAAPWRWPVSIRASSALPWRWPAWINSLSAVMASAWC